jgi:hypothetical protein
MPAGMPPKTEGNIPGAETGLGMATVVPPTPNIPGSGEQKVQAARERPVPPDMERSMGSRLFDAFQVLAAGAGEMGQFGVKGAGQAKLAEVRAIQQDEFAKKAFGYIVRLNADTMRNPKDAQKSMQELQGFIEQNAEHIPLPVLNVANDVMTQFKQLNMDASAGQAAMALGGQFGPQFQAYAQLRSVKDDTGMPIYTHEQAIALSKSVPERQFQPVSVARGARLYLLNPATGEMRDAGAAGTASEPLTINELDKPIRDVLFERAAKGGMTPEELVIAHSDKNDPRHKRAVDELAAASQEATKRSEETTEKRQRQRLTAKELEAVSHVTGGKGKYQYYEDLPDNLKGQLLRFQEREADRQKEGMLLLQGIKEAYDREGNKVQVTSENLDSIRHGLATGTMFSVREKDGEPIKVMSALVPQVQYLGHLADRILAKQGGGQNLVVALKLAVARGVMTNDDAVLFDAIGKNMTLHIARMLQGARASDLDARLAAALIPNERDTVAVARKKLNFLQFQMTMERDARLGIPAALRTTFNTADAFRAIPELRGQFKGTQLSPATSAKPTGSAEDAGHGFRLKPRGAAKPVSEELKRMSRGATSALKRMIGVAE